MKKLFLSLALCLFAFTMFISCGGSTPADKAEECVGFMKDSKYEALVNEISFPEDATPEQVEETKKMFTALLTEKGSKQIEEKGGIQSYEVVEETISEDGKTAQVKIDIKYGNGTNEVETFDLVLVDGEWKLKLNK